MKESKYAAYFKIFMNCVQNKYFQIYHPFLQQTALTNYFFFNQRTNVRYLIKKGYLKNMWLFFTI